MTAFTTEYAIKAHVYVTMDFKENTVKTSHAKMTAPAMAVVSREYAYATMAGKKQTAPKE